MIVNVNYSKLQLSYTVNILGKNDYKFKLQLITGSYNVNILRKNDCECKQNRTETEPNPRFFQNRNQTEVQKSIPHIPKNNYRANVWS